MTEQEVLKNYQISFLNEISRGTISNFFHGGGEMEIYFTFLKSPITIEGDIIPIIDHYINGNSFPIDNDISVGGGYLVEVTLLGVNFINPQTYQVDQVIPLDDFKIIAQSWANNNKKQGISLL